MGASLRYYAVSGLLRNCAPALSIIQNGAVGRALPELFHHPRWSLSMTTTGRWDTPASSTAPASTSLRCGSGRWCSRPPLLQFRLGWSLFQQSNLDLPHGKGGEERKNTGKKEWERQEMDVDLLRASLFSERGGGVMQRAAGSSGGWGGESEQTYRSFHGHAPMGLFLQH